MNGFARSLVLTSRQKATRKWQAQLEKTLHTYYRLVILKPTAVFGGTV